MKTKILILLAVGTLFVSGSFASQKEANKENKAEYQTKCPVTGRKINKVVYFEYKGVKIYACCRGCIPTIKDKPGKFLQHLKNEKIKLDKTKKDAKSEDSFFLNLGSD
jgi:hypothetical protein